MNPTMKFCEETYGFSILGMTWWRGPWYVSLLFDYLNLILSSGHYNITMDYYIHDHMVNLIYVFWLLAFLKMEKRVVGIFYSYVLLLKGFWCWRGGKKNAKNSLQPYLMFALGHDDSCGMSVKLWPPCTPCHLQKLGRRVFLVTTAYVLWGGLDNHQMSR